MVVFSQKRLYSGKGGCIRVKVVAFGQGGSDPSKWLYSGSCGCIRAKMIFLGQYGCIRVKLFFSGRN